MHDLSVNWEPPHEPNPTTRMGIANIITKTLRDISQWTSAHKVVITRPAPYVIDIVIDNGEHYTVTVKCDPPISL